MPITFKEREVKDFINIVIDFFRENEKKINNLNVFPVPDGDTGTNMLLTLRSIQKEIETSDKFDLNNITEKATFGALMGARGNSGVILSQILKGFFDYICKKDEIYLNDLLEAFKTSRDLAYDSVQNPTEGTMLTTIKDIHKSVEKISKDETELNYLDLLDKVIKDTEKSVVRTTFILPVLKEADVVDAGAQGILDILIGIRKAIIALERNSNIKNNNKTEVSEMKSDGNNKNTQDNEDKKEDFRDLKDIKVKSDIKFIYCTELVVEGKKINIDRLREYIESLGDSALVVGNKNMAKVHVHTNHPQRVLNRCLKEGILHEIDINNMVDQRKEAIGEEAGEEKEKAGIEAGILTVANGEGLEEIFRSIGTDLVIKGGQSMNPSTYDLVKAINNSDFEKLIILPNNKNIILTANQAKKITKKDLYVIPTKNIPQGITAILNYNPDLDIEENLINIEESIKNIKTGEVTKAVRNANLHVGKIEKGSFIGLDAENVRVVSNSAVNAVIELIRDLMEGNEDLITFYLGQEAKEEDNKKISTELKKLYPKIEIEFLNGGQPLYPYIFSIE